jgi:hypothetical protein
VLIILSERRLIDSVDLLVDIDVPDLATAIAFYGDAFGLTVTRP